MVRGTTTNHKAYTRCPPPSTSGGELVVESPGKWREEPQQTTRLIQDGPPQLVVENPGKWRKESQQTTRLIQDGSPQLAVENPGKW